MLPIKVKEVIKAVDGDLINGNPNSEITNICTDTRKLKTGDFFIPLLGKNFDGHDYIKEAAELGACGYLTSSDDKIILKGLVIKVKDTLKAFQEIAKLYRKKFNVTVIGITGSTGKTSAKDMIYEVLTMKYKTLKTQDNFNNHIGLPITLLNLTEQHEFAVAEMGMNHIGELSTLSKIANPYISVITNVGLAHIGNLGSKQNILKAKMEIFDGMSSDGTAILNADDGLLYGLKNLLKLKTVYCGLQDEADIQAYDIKVLKEMRTSFKIKFNNYEYVITIPAPGIHNVYNALTAVAVGIYCKVPIEDIIKGISNYKPSKMRMNIIKLTEEMQLIDDTYNANPISMKESLKILKDITGARKIAVLGDMLELGEWTRNAHIDIGKSVVENEINYIVTLGKNSKYIGQGAVSCGMSQKKILTCATIEEVNNKLKNLLRKGDVILVKGSRGMEMENVVKFILGGVK